jgi:hypothetical protein
MAINVARYSEEPDILWWRFDGRWTWRNLDEALNESGKMAGAASQRFDVILDVREMGLPPADLVQQLRQRASKQRGAGIQIIVGADYYLTLLWAFMADHLPGKWQVHFAHTLQDARSLICANRHLSEKYPKIASTYQIS